MIPRHHPLPLDLSEPTLLAQLGWTPSLNEISELSENFIQLYLLSKNVLQVAQYGGSYDL
jgi:hypothetical protein